MHKIVTDKYNGRDDFVRKMHETFDQSEFDTRVSALSKFNSDIKQSSIIKEMQKALDETPKNLKMSGGEPTKSKPVFTLLPELVESTPEGKAVKNLLTEVNEKNKYNDIPENILRLSLLEDMLIIEDPKPTINITTESFSGDSGPVLFYNPLCPNCQNFAPIFMKLAKMLEGKCPVGIVDCLDRMNGNDILSTYLNLSSYPNVKVYNNGTFVDYTGGADLKKLLSFICVVTGKCLE
jgi:thiol-disulfide isomerase/thioredoxin